MNKVDMIATMAEVSGLSKKDCEAALTAFLAATEKALKAGDKVQLVGFGSFEAKERAALQIPAERRSHSEMSGVPIPT